MKIRLFVSAVKTPFDSEYRIRVSNENHTADETMQEKKIGSFEFDLPSDVKRDFAELLIDDLENLILKTNEDHTDHVKHLFKKLNFLNELKNQGESHE